MSLGIFIPARTTSKRLPNKLLLPIGNNMSLFEIACQKIALLPEQYGKYVLVCEDPLIEIAEKYGITILHRDPETIELDDPIIRTMGGVAQAKETHMMFLNPCLAFLRYDTIVNALETFEASHWDYATSVKPFHNWLFNMSGHPVTNIDYSSLNTKAVKGLYQMAHCFHIFNKQQFLKDGLMLHDGHGIIHVAEEETTDVDTMEEYLYAKWKWENLRG